MSICPSTISSIEIYFQNSIFRNQTTYLYIHFHRVSFRFGAITMVSGIIGVPLGTYIAQKLKKRSQRADPIICACGLIISAPLLAGSMIMVQANATIAYTLVFFGEVALNLNWAIVADILLVRKCDELRSWTQHLCSLLLFPFTLVR